jgi:hypothetical protein
MDQASLIIEFAKGTTLFRQPDNTPKLPIVQNGPPGTFVVFADGSKVPLPTDQIVSSDDSHGAAKVGFGGMDFAGLLGSVPAEPLLTFHRVRDLQPPETLPPGRGQTMTLKPHMVEAVKIDGKLIWPPARPT